MEVYCVALKIIDGVEMYASCDGGLSIDFKKAKRFNNPTEVLFYDSTFKCFYTKTK